MSIIILKERGTYSFSNIDDHGLVLGGVLASVLGDQGPELVQVQGGLEVLVSLIVEVALSLLAVVTRVTANS